MKKSIKKKWVAALRSGKYKQGKRALVAGRGKASTYCCLGVLCDILPKPAKKGVRHWGENGGRYFLSRKALALVDLDPIQAGGLAAMNDSGDSFGQIADYIECHL